MGDDSREGGGRGEHATTHASWEARSPKKDA